MRGTASSPPSTDSDASHNRSSDASSLRPVDAADCTAAARRWGKTRAAAEAILNIRYYKRQRSRSLRRRARPQSSHTQPPTATDTSNTGNTSIASHPTIVHCKLRGRPRTFQFPRGTPVNTAVLRIRSDPGFPLDAYITLGNKNTHTIPHHILPGGESTFHISTRGPSGGHQTGLPASGAYVTKQTFDTTNRVLGLTFTGRVVRRIYPDGAAAATINAAHSLFPFRKGLAVGDTVIACVSGDRIHYCDFHELNNTTHTTVHMYFT